MRNPPPASRMSIESAEASAVVAHQIAANEGIVAALAGTLAARSIRRLLFCARGSSDNAALYGRYVVQAALPVLATSCPPSFGSVYAGDPDLAGTLFVGVSQSGRSPDIVGALARAGRLGAATLAAVNVQPSPLADAADIVLPLHAGEERSVAATKSFIASLAAMLHLATAWGEAPAIDRALRALPAALDAAAMLDWGEAMAPLKDRANLLVLGRGPGFAIAREAALKFKEVCGIHAEAVSIAEARHGPMALIGRDFPVLMFVQDDASRADSVALAEELVARGACVIVAGARVAGAIALPGGDGDDPLVAPVVQIAAFYRLAEAIARARGRDPDAPPYLHKVTETR